MRTYWILKLEAFIVNKTSKSCEDEGHYRGYSNTYILCHSTYIHVRIHSILKYSSTSTVHLFIHVIVCISLIMHIEDSKTRAHPQFTGNHSLTPVSVSIGSDTTAAARKWSVLRDILDIGVLRNWETDKNFVDVFVYSNRSEQRPLTAVWSRYRGHIGI